MDDDNSTTDTDSKPLSDMLHMVGLKPLPFALLVIFIVVEIFVVVGITVCILMKWRREYKGDYHPLGPDYFLVETPEMARATKQSFTGSGIHANTDKPPARTTVVKTHKRTISDPFAFPVPAMAATEIVMPQKRLDDQTDIANKGAKPKREKPPKIADYRGISVPEETVSLCPVEGSTILEDNPVVDKTGSAKEKRVKFAMAKSQTVPANLFKMSGSIDIGSIDPDLYRFDRTNFVKDLPSRHGLGKISFALTYDEELEQLHIFVDQGAQFPAKSAEALPDTAVQIILTKDGDQPSATTRVVRKNQNPIFRQDFVFQFAADEIKDTMIKFKVCEFDRFSHMVQLGQVLYILDSYKQLDGGPPIWRDLQPPVVTVKPVNRGELLVSLTFLPNAEKLNVVILKGRKIKLPEWRISRKEKSVDTFVKLTLVKSGKIIKTKNTGVCRRTCNPTFNEGFSMSLQQSELDEACLVCTVSLRLNHFGSSRMLGRCVIGKLAEAEGASHWRDMINSPRSGVAQWHTLR